MQAARAGLMTAGRGAKHRTDESLAGRAEIVLLTTDGYDFRRVNVDALSGDVTLRGDVKTASEKEKAGLAVWSVDGVHHVNNLLQVVPEMSVKASDQALKDRIEKTLRSDRTIDSVKVASVKDGVVLLSGKRISLAEKLRAIELAWNVNGLASEADA